MNSRSYCSPVVPSLAATSSLFFACIQFLTVAVALLCPSPARADAPAWMHALVNVPVPAHDEKTEAILLYSEETLNVQSNGKMKKTVRQAYKILRPAGKKYGQLRQDFDSETRINYVHAWCIPAQGKDYEIKDKEAMETALFGVLNGELVTDVRSKLLQIPAADPGNIVGYEVEREQRPYILQDFWGFQESIPVREAHYTLQLPAGWEYKASWLNHAEVKPSGSGNQWQWVITDVPAVRQETAMPPAEGVAGLMLVSLVPSGGGPRKGFESWDDMGRWEAALAQDRRTASPDIKQKVAALTASSPSTLAKMRALALFVQSDIRYVAIQLGIGGWQPHPAPDIFTHKYGDCKDKATLMSTMLKEIGVDSYYLSVNTQRGTVTPATPAVRWFDHEILAVRLPDDVKDPSLNAVFEHPKLGRLLIFDPTDELTPFGQLRGPLQANYALLVGPDAGELILLPKLPTGLTGVRRSAKLTLSASGVLSGEVTEVRLGDSAAAQRSALRSVSSDKEKIKPIESLLAHSLATYRITKASVTNLQQSDQPFGYNYSVVAEGYAKSAGNLLLVRPRFVGSKSSDLLETKEPRRFPVEFDGPSLDSDTFEITLPPGYEVDDLPPPVEADFGFASYRSKTEAQGSILRYTRTFEVKDVTVPLAKIEDLKKLYRIIASDERSTAVLKPNAH
jgi:uncharacterized protein DUF3857/transglutaminase superfamily protein